MTETVIHIAKQFSPSPAGRYHPDDGPYTGQLFREKLLLPAVRSSDHVAVILDETDGFGSSFLEEAFGGLVRAGVSADVLRKKLRLVSARKSYPERIWGYIDRARAV